MNQAQETPLGVSAGRLALAYKELFPNEFDLENLPEVEHAFTNWLERFNKTPEKAIATKNWAGKVTQALFHALGVTQPKTKRDMLAALKNPQMAVRIVEYTLDYVHRVQVAVPSCSDADAIAKAEEAFDNATIWDDVPSMPLLYDDYEETQDNTLVFKVVDVVKGMEYLPPQDPSARAYHQNMAAKDACSLLLQAYKAAKKSGKDSISLHELAAACEAAASVNSVPREPVKVLVKIEDGVCNAAYSTAPVEIAIVDQDMARDGDIDKEDRIEKIVFPDGVKVKAMLIEDSAAVVPDFVRKVFAMKVGNLATRGVV